MKESKHNICKMPGCNKEVYDSNMLFCGEHQRAFREFKEKSRVAIGTVGMAAVIFITKNIRNKKS